MVFRLNQIFELPKGFLSSFLVEIAIVQIDSIPAVDPIFRLEQDPKT